jgi:hypothetical protein
VSFKRVFLRDAYSNIDKCRYQPGDIEDVNQEIFHSSLKQEDESPSGFIQYFLEPNSLNNKKYKNLTFVVIPDIDNFNSYNGLKDLFREKKPKPVQKHRIRDPAIDDRSVPNTHSIKEAKKVIQLKKLQGGIYLSDIVRFLCRKHPKAYITIIVSACRSFHDEIPLNVKRNQKKTARVSALKYYREFSSKDSRVPRSD